MVNENDEAIFAVMGVTGVGKSSFVKLVTGNPDVKIGNDLFACTSEVKSYSFRYKSTNFVIVDTPGFDDTYLSDLEVLRRIYKWLEDSYRSGKKLTGVIYLHRITDVRMQGSVMQNLFMFQKLCGPNSYKNVVLGTTFWGSVGDRGAAFVNAVAREKELKANDMFWTDMIKRGSEVVRMSDDQTVARDLLFRLSKKSKIVLNAQNESVHQGKKFDEADAGKAFFMHEIMEESLRKEREKAKKKLEDEAREAARKREAQRLKMEREVEEKIKKQEEEQRRVREELKKEEKRRQEEHERKMRQQKEETERLQREQEDLLKKMEQLKIDRDNDSRDKRNKRLIQEAMELMSLLAEGKENGQVLFEFRDINPAYTATCCNCLENIGCGSYWSCTKGCLDGTGEGEFAICDDCYRASGVYCNDRAHYGDMVKKELSDRQGNCARVISPLKRDMPIICDRCASPCGMVYLHCCLCRQDDFDMCLQCALSSRTCQKSWSIRGHPLDICLRFPS